MRTPLAFACGIVLTLGVNAAVTAFHAKPQVDMAKLKAHAADVRRVKTFSVSEPAFAVPEHVAAIASTLRGDRLTVLLPTPVLALEATSRFVPASCFGAILTVDGKVYHVEADAVSAQMIALRLPTEAALHLAAGGVGRLDPKGGGPRVLFHVSGLFGTNAADPV